MNLLGTESRLGISSSTAGKDETSVLDPGLSLFLVVRNSGSSGVGTGIQGPAPGPLQLLLPLPGRTFTSLFLALSSQRKSQLLKGGFPQPFDLLVFGT